MPAPESHPSAQANVVNAAILVALTLAALLLALADMGVGIAGMRLFGLDLPSSCLWRHATGTACPTCGLTRALALLLHGNLSAALAVHPSSPFVLLWGAAQWLYRTACIVYFGQCLSPSSDLLWSAGSFALAVVVPQLLVRPGLV